MASGVREAILAHARTDQPHECCGLLLGAASRIVRAVAARNTATSPATRYTIDPADHFVAIREARASGLEVIGAYHSHPRSAPRPSATDLTEAFGEFIYVIVGLVEAEPAIEAWRLAGGNFVPLRLVPE